MELRAPRLEVPPMHGLGCSLSALITGYLALGLSVRDAVKRAHDVLHAALRQPSRIGEGLSILANLAVSPSTQN
jgi:hydroxymethylpyrimidine/phosphomethylpyrimidine kinase